MNAFKRNLVLVQKSRLNKAAVGGMLPAATRTLLKTRARRTLLLGVACASLATAPTGVAHSQTLNPGIIDPTNSYAGKTYSEWEASFWEYYAGLPTTNNPFERPTGYPIAPLGTGQSGPVWFLGGNFYPGSPYPFTYTDTVPGGIALFTAVALDEWGNDRCVAPITEGQMRANAAAKEDTVTSMAITIDGIAVNYIDDVMTTPYRVRSIYFNYTTPAVHSVLFDALGRSCYYPNAGGPPFEIDGAVVDGVFLMIAPLSAGQHTIAGSFVIPSVISETWTRTLNVLPVTLTASAGSSPGSLSLSWPQTPDRYSVETSDSLDAPQWQPANLTPTLSNRVYQVSTQTRTNHQFFRLRMN
jgi:hypothetical protein